MDFLLQVRLDAKGAREELAKANLLLGEARCDVVGQVPGAESVRDGAGAWTDRGAAASRSGAGGAATAADMVRLMGAESRARGQVNPGENIFFHEKYGTNA